MLDVIPILIVIKIQILVDTVVKLLLSFLEFLLLYRMSDLRGYASLIYAASTLIQRCYVG